MSSNSATTPNTQVQNLPKYLAQIWGEEKKKPKTTQKNPRRAIGGSTLKYFLTSEIKMPSEYFTCKKLSQFKT